MQTESEQPRRREGDLRPNWSMIGVLLAFAVNVCMIVWMAATTSAAVQQTRSDNAELKAGISTLQNQSTNNAVRIGVLESKVDDVRDEQRRLIK